MNKRIVVTILANGVVGGGRLLLLYAGTYEPRWEGYEFSTFHWSVTR